MHTSTIFSDGKKRNVAVTEHLGSWKIFKKIKITYYPTSWKCLLLIVIYNHSWDFHTSIFFWFPKYFLPSLWNMILKIQNISVYMNIYLAPLHNSYLLFYFKYPSICCYHIVLNSLVIFRANAIKFKFLQRLQWSMPSLLIYVTMFGCAHLS